MLAGDEEGEERNHMKLGIYGEERHRSQVMVAALSETVLFYCLSVFMMGSGL